MDRAHLERKYALRTEVWKQDALAMADWYEERIAAMAERTRWKDPVANPPKKSGKYLVKYVQDYAQDVDTYVGVARYSAEPEMSLRPWERLFQTVVGWCRIVGRCEMPEDF